MKNKTSKFNNCLNQHYINWLKHKDHDYKYHVKYKLMLQVLQIFQIENQIERLEKRQTEVSIWEVG